MVRKVSGTDVPDAPSGFRARTRDARKTHVFSEYTYTLETIIQADQKGFAVASVPVRVNETLRPSRLVTSIPDSPPGPDHPSYLCHLPAVPVLYHPGKFPLRNWIPDQSSIPLLLPDRRWERARSVTDSVQPPHEPGVLLGFIGLLADLLSVNRKLLEQLEWRIQNVEESLRGKDDEDRGVPHSK